jgi:O-antigen/teichoic acid export membrane protein
MGVTLYTSRIVLAALGISDYGIYNIVGGLVAMFGFINGAMASATQRYLSFDIGAGDLDRLKKTFSVSLSIHIIIALIVILLGETLGLWYINFKMVFPKERLSAVNIVYQFSLLTLFWNIIQVPYNSLLLAREKMNIYAYVSLLEAVLKLGTAIIIIYYGNDKLILYGILTFSVSFIMRVIYQSYCRRNFAESKYKFHYDKSYFKEILNYSGWNLFGALSLVGKNQGINIVLNLFFGTVINAAYGVAMQVQAAVTQFVNSFQSALNPQIVQSYAGGNRVRSLNLIFLGAKFSFYLMQFLAIPILMNVSWILKFWLGNNVPEYTISFVSMSLVALLIDSVSGPFMTGIQAAGNISLYQIVVGSLNLIIPILSYVLFKLGNDPLIAFIILIGFSVLSLIIRIVFLKRFYLFTLFSFFKQVGLPILYISFSAYIVSIFLNKVLVVNSLLNMVVWGGGFVLIQAIIVFLFGLNSSLRIRIVGLVRNKLKF